MGAEIKLVHTVTCTASAHTMYSLKYYISVVLYHCATASHIVGGVPVKYVHIGNNVTILCNVESGDHQYKTWWRNSTEIQTQQNKFNIYKENKEYFLQILEAAKEDSGLYQCLSSKGSPEKFHTYTVLVSVEEIYVDQDYSDNVIRGVVAAAVFIAVVTTSCLIYKYRWRNKDQLEEDTAYISYGDGKIQMHITPKGESKGIDNPAVEIDADSSPSNTKM